MRSVPLFSLAYAAACNWAICRDVSDQYAALLGEVNELKAGIEEAWSTLPVVIEESCETPRSHVPGPSAMVKQLRSGTRVVCAESSAGGHGGEAQVQGPGVRAVDVMRGAVRDFRLGSPFSPAAAKSSRLTGSASA